MAPPSTPIVTGSRSRIARSTRTTAALAAAALTVGLALVPAAPAGASTAPSVSRAKAPAVKTVTLITGDVVRVSRGLEGQKAITLLPRPDGTIPQAAVNEVSGHVYVVPTEAFGLLAADKLDRDLFDVTQLLRDDYDDTSRSSIPLIVDYGKGKPAAAEASSASLNAATVTVTVPALGVAAFHASKKNARSFWDDLTTGEDATGRPTALADGASRVDLDGRIEVALEDSVPQINAPQAWAAGYEGDGVRVAVLDSGYDATHPDLVGRVSTSANFTSDDSVADGNGHGTHVASTVGGTGAASSGLRRGVAPKVDLMIGKVIGNYGYGEDSWVLAGMQWAVDQGADIVNMSLGGDADDGSHPLSRAVDELSSSSDTLFVIAAGNNGSAGPGSITSPGAADAALTVGAVDVNDVMAEFSGRGPRLINGALKPEVVAPGVDVTAARATGTDLGGDFDSNPTYTTISGTSMATPHVAGLAALLKQQHPGWDGERLKDVIANSAVPIADATSFEAGTGRVDALRAFNQTVVAPATRELGNFAWPYDDLAPVTKPVAYTNTTNAPVTLSLALTSQDGTAETSGALSLGSDEVTVPAHGAASVDVTVDPTVAGPGGYSAVVTATLPDGETVRTGVAYQLETERYDVEVTIQPRAGATMSHQLGLSGFNEPWLYEQRTFDASPDSQSVTFRLPPGDYSTGVISSGIASDGATEGVVTYEPAFTVSQNTEVVLDENETTQVKYAVDRPVVSDGTILDVSWDGAAGHTGFMLYGFADRAYVRPSAGLAGTTSLAANFMLSRPEGMLTPAGNDPVALRPVPATGLTERDATVASIDTRRRVVDLGSVNELRPVSPVNAVVVVESDCADLGPLAEQLERSRAVAVIAYPAPGATCAGTLDLPVGIPVMQARPFDADRLLSGGTSPARIKTHAATGYIYDLVEHFPESVPAEALVDATGDHVGAIKETYRGLGSTSADGLAVLEELYGWVPSRGGVANIGLVRKVPFPATVTHYVSTGAEWERTVSILDAQFGGEYARLWGGRKSFEGGSITRDTWFGGPIGSRVSELMSLTNGAPPPIREIAVDPETGKVYRDEMFLSQGAFTDAAGHLGHSDLWSPEYSGKIFADGELVLDMWASVFMNTEVPRGEHRFRIVTDLRRENLFWQRSTQIRTAWAFTSDTPTRKEIREVLPMLGVTYGLDLSPTGSAHAGAFSFRVGFTLPEPLRSSSLVERSVQISWNGGATWKVAKLRNCSATACDVGVNNQSGKQATLRVMAKNAAGQTVKQKIVNAYAVR